MNKLFALALIACIVLAAGCVQKTKNNESASPTPTVAAGDEIGALPSDDEAVPEMAIDDEEEDVDFGDVV